MFESHFTRLSLYKLVWLFPIAIFDDIFSDPTLWTFFKFLICCWRKNDWTLETFPFQHISKFSYIREIYMMTLPHPIMSLTLPLLKTVTKFCRVFIFRKWHEIISEKNVSTQTQTILKYIPPPTTFTQKWTILENSKISFWWNFDENKAVFHLKSFILNYFDETRRKQNTV